MAGFQGQWDFETALESPELDSGSRLCTQPCTMESNFGGTRFELPVGVSLEVSFAKTPTGNVASLLNIYAHDEVLILYRHILSQKVLYRSHYHRQNLTKQECIQ